VGIKLSDITAKQEERNIINVKNAEELIIKVSKRK
jgi:hypothetical protein